MFTHVDWWLIRRIDQELCRRGLVQQRSRELTSLTVTVRLSASGHKRLATIKPSSGFSSAQFCVFTAWKATRRDEHAGSEHIWFPLKLHRDQNVWAEDAASLIRVVWRTKASFMFSLSLMCVNFSQRLEMRADPSTDYLVFVYVSRNNIKAACRKVSLSGSVKNQLIIRLKLEEEAALSSTGTCPRGRGMG